MKKKFEIGLFALNSSSGIAMTKVKERWKADWNEIQNVAKISDKAGIDFIIAVQRWLGFEGATNPAGLTYDSLTFCAGLAAVTKKIKLFATIHVPLVHPTFAARALATIDQISKGRANVNLVCGWNKREFDMFNVKNQDYINRYDEGEEWIQLLQKILSKKKFTPFNGKYFKTEYSTTSPKLYKKNSIHTLSAAFSDRGREFAAKNCGSLITMFSNFNSAKKQTKSIKSNAKKYGNRIKVYGLVHVVCRKTDDEAIKYYDRYASKMADKSAINNFISILNKGNSNNVLSSLQKSQMKKMAGGIGSYPIIGCPKSIIKQINELKLSGLDGIAIGFVNYQDELPFFINNVIKKIGKNK